MVCKEYILIILFGVVVADPGTEATPKSGAAIVQKSWAERLNDEPELESDADEQLLMYIPLVDLYIPRLMLFSGLAFFSTFYLPHHSPLILSQSHLHTSTKLKLFTFYSFTGQVKVHSLLIYTAPTPSAPKTLKLFKNRDNLDFATASELAPTQKLEIPQPVPGSDVFELNLNRAHWNTTTSITLFFEDNWSYGEEDVTKVGYIGFKGQFTALNREPINFLYEAAANPGDHVSIPGISDVGGRIMPGQ